MVLGRVLVFSALVIHLCAQTDWDCNHYGFLPTDTCLDFGSFSTIYECEGTDSLKQVAYNSDNCSGTELGSRYLNDTDFQCDQSETCDYMSIAVYNDSSCTEFGYQTAYVIGECIITSNYSSLEFDCSDTAVIENTYLNQDCSGSPYYTSERDASNFTGSACAELDCIVKSTTTEGDDESTTSTTGDDESTTSTTGDDGDDDEDTDAASRIGSLNLEQIFAFILALAVYKF